MPPAAAVFCPECSAKNKQGWEFCARCGGPLGDAAASPPAPRAARAPARTERAGPSLTGLLGGLAVLGLTAGAWVMLRGQAQAPAPSADLFSVPPAAVPLPTAAADTSEWPELRQGRERLSAGDLEGAVALLSAAVAQHPDDLSLRHLYAQALWRAGQKEAALEQFGAAAARDPGQRLDFAKSLEAMGRVDEALEQYRSAVSHDPGNDAALKALGNALLAARRPSEAVEPLRSAVALAPNDILTAQQLASALEGSGDLPAAEQAYRQVLERMPEATISRGRLAEVLQAQGRGQEAIDLLREGLQRAPDSPNLQRSLGAVLDRNGRSAEAAAAFREYLRLAPNSPEAPLVQQRLAELGQSAAPAAPAL